MNRLGWRGILALIVVAVILLWLYLSARAASAACNSYTVQRGDTLGQIARQYGTSVQAIANANGITNVNLIHVGQRLCVPSGSAPAGQPAAAPASSGSCVDVATLARQRGWTVGNAVDHGGVVVQLARADVLPAGYEATGPNRTILTNSLGNDRNMGTGYWTVYAKCGSTAAPAPAQAPQAQPQAQPATSTNSCMLGKDLAAQRGWAVLNLPESVTKYGGAVVSKSPGSLPANWEEICNGGVCSIYPPNGTCRDQLGVNR